MTDNLDAIAAEPEPSAAAEPEPTAAAEPEPTAAAEPEPPAGEPAEETVDGLPVLVEAHPVPVAAPAPALPAVQAAAVAATSFVAGAATLALVKRHSARKLARTRNVPRRAVDMLPIVGSRTFIVDVHLLAKPE